MSEIKKTKKDILHEKIVAELTSDMQRIQADFENYRKRTEAEKLNAREQGQASAIMKLIPVIDNIERALTHLPEELKDNAWAKSVAGLSKHLEKSLDVLNVKKINSLPGAFFDPTLHEAIQFDEDAVGDTEVIKEEMQAGYTLNGQPIRHAMVKVTKK